MPRIFIAIDLAPHLREELTRVSSLLVERLPDDLRPTPPPQLHLTLAFIGDSDRVADLRRIIEDVASAHPPLPLRLSRLGFFSSRGATRVVWGGINTTPDLITLVDSLRRELGRSDFPTDERPFAPHITLARTRRPIRSSLVDTHLREITLEPVTQVADSLTLFSSTLTPRGALHETTHCAVLSAATS